MNTYLSATLGSATNRKNLLILCGLKNPGPFASIDEQIFGLMQSFNVYDKI